MMRRAAETRARELEEEAERMEAAQADGEIRLHRLRAEKKVLLAEIRRGVGGGGSSGSGGGGGDCGGTGGDGCGDGGATQARNDAGDARLPVGRLRQQERHL